jgi:hypothetical protein
MFTTLLWPIENGGTTFLRHPDDSVSSLAKKKVYLKINRTSYRTVDMVEVEVELTEVTKQPWQAAGWCALATNQPATLF